MPIIPGRTYLDNQGKRATIQGPTKNDPDMVYTAGGDWFSMKDGKGKSPRSKFLIDDFDIPKKEAIAKLVEARQPWIDGNPPERLRQFMSTEMWNFQLRIAMHEADIPLDQFEALDMVHFVNGQLAQQPNVWNFFQEYEGARELYKKLKLE